MVSPVRSEQYEVYVPDTLCAGEKHCLGNIARKEVDSKELSPITNMGKRNKRI